MEEITLGQHEGIPVYAQKWKYLFNRTSKVIVGIINNSQDMAVSLNQKTLQDWVGGSSYDLLVAMIPTVGKRIPEYEFNGFESKEAWDKDEYDEDKDNSPTIPEIEEAFKVAIRVNRFDIAKVLTGLIDPKKIRESLTERISKAISDPSVNLQQVSGESILTNSTMTPQTPMPNEVSLLSDWRSSQKGTSQEGTGS